MAKTDAAGQWAADDREGPSPCRGDDDDESSDDDDFANELEAGLVEEEEKRTILGKRDFDDVADSRGGDRGCTLKAARTTATTATLGMDGELRERPRPHVQHDGAPGLASLPSDLTTQVLRYLSPEDLTVLATTCRALRGPAVDDSLWRRCYCTRFGHPKHQRDETLKQARSGGVGGGSWRVLYFDDDARELRQAVKNTPPELSPIYAQMQAAKRSQAPDPAVHGDDVLLTLTDAERVSRWRAFKGLGDCTETSSSHHSCSLRLGCAFHRFGADIFVCEATGRAHVCDDACRERVVDMDGMRETCEISGRSFDRILDEGAEGMVGGCDPAPERGWLAAAYEAGYGASSEKEMYAALWGGGGCAAIRANGCGADDSEDDAGSSDSSDSEID